jgi:hypothetical protein
MGEGVEEEESNTYCAPETSKTKKQIKKND